MAISKIEFRFLAEAYKSGCLLRGGRILEFGEANTNRINENEIDVVAAIKLLMPESPQRSVMVARATELERERDLPSRYEEARMIYRALFDYTSYTAIDLLPPAEHRIQQDLNEFFSIGGEFDVCINNGTSEHIFNQANCYRAIHDHTRAGGIMIHWTPCIGWVNHGMFHVQPSFFHDLSSSNSYEILLAKFAGSENLYNLDPSLINAEMFKVHPDLQNALACTVLRKTVDRPFRYPLQGKYNTLKRFA